MLKCHLTSAARHDTPHEKGPAMANLFVRLELNTPDLAGAKEFYAAMFG